jgi:hypothetical protein
MQTPGTQNPQYPNPYAAQVGPRAAACEGHSDGHFLMGLGVVLLVCGGAITGHHEVTMVGLALIIFSSWVD